MRLPEALRRNLRGKWLKHRQVWLAGDGDWPLSLPIGGDGLKADAVADRWDAFDAWLKAWKQLRAQRSFGRVGDSISSPIWKTASSNDCCGSSSG